MLRLLKCFSPLGAIFFGAVMKIALIDKVPETCGSAFIKENYCRPLWIEFIIVSAALLGDPIINESFPINKNQKLFWALAFLIIISICLLMAVIIPKFGFKSEIYSIWAPMIFSMALMVAISSKLSR